MCELSLYLATWLMEGRSGRERTNGRATHINTRLLMLLLLVNTSKSAGQSLDALLVRGMTRTAVHSFGRIESDAGPSLTVHLGSRNPSLPPTPTVLLQFLLCLERARPNQQYNSLYLPTATLQCRSCSLRGLACPSQPKSLALPQSQYQPKFESQPKSPTST